MPWLVVTHVPWSYHFFSNWNKSNEVPSKIQEKEIIEAYRSMEEYNWNKAEREAYVKANIALTDEYDARRKEREEGKTEGRAEGEKAASLKIAKNLLGHGFSSQQINTITGLSPDEIEGQESLSSELFLYTTRG